MDVKRSKRKSSTELARQQSSQRENLLEKKKTPVAVRYSKRSAIKNYFVRYIEFLNSPCIIFYYDTVIHSTYINIYNLENKQFGYLYVYNLD